MRSRRQPNELAEYAALVELAADHRAALSAAERRAWSARRALDRGARAQLVADTLGVSRATLYRMISTGQPDRTPTYCARCGCNTHTRCVCAKDCPDHPGGNDATLTGERESL